MNGTSLKHVSWYLIGINCSLKSWYLPLTLPIKGFQLSPHISHQKQKLQMYTRTEKVISTHISHQSHIICTKTKKVGTKKDIERERERERIPLIFGVLICFRARDWSCWSSSWRASLALSGSTSNCCESFSVAWTTQDRKEDGFFALVFLEASSVCTSDWDTVSALVLLEKDVGGGDTDGLLRNERLRRESIWMWEMKPQPLSTV